MLAATFFDQLDQTKQSPRNAKSAATQLWGNLKPVGNVGKVFSLWENPGPFRIDEESGKADKCTQYWETIVLSPCLKFPKKREKQFEDNNPNLNLPV